jgi:hypothetical protein
MLMLKRKTVPVALLIVLATGCSSNEDQRLVQLAREADQRQADQNHAMARQNEQIVEATKQLVEADAKSRQELVSLERDMQVERADIGHERDLLEAERKELSNARQRDSLLVEVLGDGIALAACLLPLILAWYLLHGLRSQNSDEALGELLVMELAADNSSPLLPGPANRPPPDGLLPFAETGDTASPS